jgi:Tfp pilus assembly protein PilN
MDAARAQVAARAPLPARAPVPPAQATAVNAAVLQLNLPWRALHDAVQSATPAGIALLALEPDAKRSSLRITAEARSSDDMIGYVEALRQQDWFSAVALVRHEINEQDPNRPIRFQVDAAWRAAP